MARWVITNSDGSPCDATIDDNGLANIPENTGDTAITYWVRYFDDEGCSAGTYYNVEATIIKCDETDYEEVDLGLPSGNKWANKNLGAKCPQMTGNYYSFASTKGYSGVYIKDEQDIGHLMFNGEDAAYSDSSSTDCMAVTYTKYGGGSDQIRYLTPIDDAATKELGGNWETPTIDDFEELFNTANTNVEELRLDSELIGYRISKKDNADVYIDMPCCKYVQDGIRDDCSGSNKLGFYWRYMTNTVNFDDSTECSAFCASYGESCIESRHPRRMSVLRCCGLQVRPLVRKDAPTPTTIAPIIVENHTNKTLWIYDNIEGSKIKNDMPCIEPGETWTSSIVYNYEGVHFVANVTCNMSVDEHFEPTSYDVQKRYYLGDKINIKLYAEGEDEDEGWAINEIIFTGYPTDGVEFAINESGTSYKQLKLITGSDITQEGEYTYG